MRRKKTVSSVVLTLVAAVFLACAGQVLAQTGSSRQDSPFLDHFKIRVTPDKEDEGLAVVELLYKGRAIFSGNEFKPDLEKQKRLRATPVPGSESAVQQLFTGGAHCCFTNLLWTVSGSQEMAFSFELEHSDTFDFKDIDGDGSKEIVLIDWSFAYYNSDNSPSLFLPFASSPGIYRIMVFDGTHWRADRPGEFRPFYQKLLDKTQRKLARMTPKEKKKDITGVVGWVIEIACYHHMVGRNEGTVMKLLQTELPPSWKGMASKIYSDIRKAAADFNPVEKLL